jgi:hypothetical protein
MIIEKIKHAELILTRNKHKYIESKIRLFEVISKMEVGETYKFICGSPQEYTSCRYYALKTRRDFPDLNLNINYLEKNTFSIHRLPDIK